MIIRMYQTWNMCLMSAFILQALLCLCRELNDNHLSGCIPPELGKLTNLFDLYVLLPHEFEFHWLLHFLNIRFTDGNNSYRNVANNNLVGPIPENLSSCTNLNSL